MKIEDPNAVYVLRAVDDGSWVDRDGVIHDLAAQDRVMLIVSVPKTVDLNTLGEPGAAEQLIDAVASALERVA